MKKLDKKKIIEQFKKVHGNKYDYSLVDYVDINTKVKIICPVHGVFEQIPYNHRSLKCGCPKCNSGSYSSKKSTTKDFIKKAKIVHDDFYDYSLVDYKNNHTKVKIICPKHGIFEQIPKYHLNGSSCPYCMNRVSSQDTFVEKAKVIHNDFYNYSLVDYKNNHTKVKIICPKHGVFEQTPNSHLNGRTCPKCRTSKGENKIRNYLNNNNIIFEEQKRFKDCRDKRELPFDFYLPEYNILIEYQGRQHYELVESFGGEEQLKVQNKHDNIKKEFAKNNNFNFLEINYKDFKNTEKILNTAIYKK